MADAPTNDNAMAAAMHNQPGWRPRSRTLLREEVRELVTRGDVIADDQPLNGIPSSSIQEGTH